MTAATTSGYTASASDTSTGNDAWKAFDGKSTSSSRWRGDGTNYTSGVANTTQRLSASTPYGSWLKLHLPERVKLYRMRFNGATTQAPKTGEIWASNDDSTWTKICDFINVGNDQATTVGVNTFVEFSFTPLNDGVFEYYALIVTEVKKTTEPLASIAELEYFGAPEENPEGHDVGTDVIARSVPNAPTTDFLEVYYDAKDLSDGSISTVNDLKPSGTAVNGTASGVTVSNGAFVFDNSSDVITATLPSSVTGEWVHTVSLWFKRTATNGSTDYIFQAGTNSTGNQISLIIDSDHIWTGIWGHQTISHPKVQNNTWYHLAYTYIGGGWNPANVRTYINGLHISSWGNSTTVLNFTGSGLKIGQNDSSNRFIGSVANFRLFNRALTGDEMWQLYAYQKNYFQVSPDVLAFKNGRLGIGTTEPMTVLDVAGDIRGGCPVYFSVRCGTNASTGVIPWDTIWASKGGGFDPSTGIFTVPLTGVYRFSYGFRANTADTYTHIWYNGTLDAQARMYIRDQYNTSSMTFLRALFQGETIGIYISYGSIESAYSQFTGEYISSV